jgi:hypothetical protein
MPRSMLILRDAFVLGLTAFTTLLFLSAPVVAIILWVQIGRLIAP